MERTRYTGVYEMISKKRKYNGKPDKNFYITYKHEGKLEWEKVGWQSEGYSIRIAADIRAERIRAIRHGDELPKKKKKAPLFRDVAQKYLEWAKSNKAKGGRDDFYRYRKYLDEALGDKRMNEISSFDLERLKSTLQKEDLAAATVKHYLVLVRQIYNKAIAWREYKGENPVKGVKLPKLNNKRERFLSHAEAGLLLEELSKSSPQLHDMALLSLHCGLRAGEIFNLKGQDLDFENEIINISNPKNGESRKAYMTSAVKKMFQSYLPLEPGEFVFKDRHNRQIKEVSKTFGRVVKKIGWNEGVHDRRQRVTFHTLRHTFASWLAIQGEPILTIKELLGHKSLEMTMRYAHLAPNKNKDAALKLERIFEEEKERDLKVCSNS